MNLRTKQNRELISEIENLRGDEKLLTAKLLRYLLEIESRKLHLDMGYSSIYAFCEERLGYSKDEAYVRMQGMRLLKAVPEVADKIESGALTLSTAAKAQSVFRKENDRRKELGEIQLTNSEKKEVLLKLEGESKRNSEKLLAEEFPEVSVIQAELTKPIAESLTLIQFQADSELMEKFNELKRLMAHQVHDGKWETLFSHLADFALGKKRAQRSSTNAVEEKHSDGELVSINRTKLQNIEIRKANQTFRATGETNPLVPERSSKPDSNTYRNSKVDSKADSKLRSSSKSKFQRRYISIHTKREIFSRAQHRCEYTDRFTGTRCTSSHQLQIDHIKAKTIGGGDEIGNLRILCRAHNNHLARFI